MKKPALSVIARFALWSSVASALLPGLTEAARAATHRHASAESGSFGLGLILGEPTGLTGKYFLSHKNAVDFGLAFSFSSFFLIYADYLFEFPGAFGARDAFVAHLSPYVGAGGVLLVSTSSGRTDSKFFTDNGSVGLGFRIPLGLEWKPADPPLGVFVEIAPGIGLIPSTFGFVEGGIGARYYF